LKARVRSIILLPAFLPDQRSPEKQVFLLLELRLLNLSESAPY
jgi:hypothetical protein